MTVKEMAELAAEYTRAYKANEITPQEFKKLVGDLEIETSFEKDAAAYEQDIESHTILLVALSAAAIIPWAVL